MQTAPPPHNNNHPNNNLHSSRTYGFAAGNNAKRCSQQLGRKEKEKEKRGDWRVNMKSYDWKNQSHKIKFLMTEKRKGVFFAEKGIINRKKNIFSW